MTNELIQTPAPGTSILRFRGDTLTLSLSMKSEVKGRAWLRTNLGHARVTRREIMDEVCSGEPRLQRDWFDIPMKRVSKKRFRIHIPLCEIGHFEAKCYFLEDGNATPLWPDGPNVAINVEPAGTCCANTIYNAFVRQFGPNIAGGARPDAHMADNIKLLDNAGYTVIPPSGTFRDLIGKLDFIISELGFRIIQLLPVHPTPTTYGRMGQFGSPYAALGFLSVDPALARFDPKATPLEQFIELVDAIHARYAKLFIDIAINHTGWAARLHEKHPAWLVRDKEGAIQVPGAWGVKWEDLTKLDYTQKDLWEYMAEVFITWCRRGVDGFRCDAGYMIPLQAWQYIIAAVREQFPDTVFFNEGLGGKMSVTRDLLNSGNFNWAYSELFQNYTREQIESYLPQAIEISEREGLMVHFAETHDNLRLAEKSETWARMRTALCALFSPNGAFGFANGVEWYATEKINVHGAPSLNWGADPNQVEFISRINAILMNHPAFHDRTHLKMVQQGVGNFVVMLRYHVPTGKWLLVAANLSDDQKAVACWDEPPIKSDFLTDLLSGEVITVDRREDLFRVGLSPGRVLCLTPDSGDLELLPSAVHQKPLPPARVTHQQLRAKALEIYRYYYGDGDLGSADPDDMAFRLAKDIAVFCAEMNPDSEESRVVHWVWPRDLRRQVMVPARHFLWIASKTAFRAAIMDEKKETVLGSEASFRLDDGTHHVLFVPSKITHAAHTQRTLHLSVFEQGRTEHAEAPLLYLCDPLKPLVKTHFVRVDCASKLLLLLGTNHSGAMMRAPIRWGELPSRYDALLAANMDSDYPEDRLILLTRCRGWVRFQGYSQSLDAHCFEGFDFDFKSRGCWGFRVPTGQGEHVHLRVFLEMVPTENRVRMVVYRDSAAGIDGRLDDDKPVEVIIRPDIEWRSFHESTKAYLGAETRFPESVIPMQEKPGFRFSPRGRQQNLLVQTSSGVFVPEPQWQYMVHHFVDGERGFDPDSDLFSPGYFAVSLSGGKAFELMAGVSKEGESYAFDEASAHPPFPAGSSVEKVSLERALDEALDHYVVKRGSLKSIIAGYPWFLDWGRDSLIVARGLIAAGKMKEARAVLLQFARFERNGTLPNMINGEDAGNRDTSDAALWFLVACGDLVQKERDSSFLTEKAGERTIGEVAHSIGHFMINGTPKGVKVDPESGLIFSPAHFTWMDTDFPAGTPREGYPIEIQALWYRALKVLSFLDDGIREKGPHDWNAIAKRVEASIPDLFLENEGYLSDCLHAGPDQSAKEAEPDDALRPNQLLAITLGAVKEPFVCRRILKACDALLVPGAIRSLADRPVQRPISIVLNGRTLNDPRNPYWGRYAGDEDTRRKPAYHNGTAWTWMFPSYCEAWAETYGDASRKTALSWLSAGADLMNSGCLGQVPEILDGDFPHTQRGCDAQAWGVSELLRVWLKLIA
ncbi:putative glycogen debranching enzyme, archaeal type [delta proteobacterium NaphS2]|nr:putative glycogen debranching enzyme, archaeal type [delta proteobacterium NaphS2]